MTEETFTSHVHRLSVLFFSLYFHFVGNVR